jgi:hypothetical protein
MISFDTEAKPFIRSIIEKILDTWTYTTIYSANIKVSGYDLNATKAATDAVDNMKKIRNT